MTVVEGRDHPEIRHRQGPEFLAVEVVLADFVQIHVPDQEVPAPVRRACRNWPWMPLLLVFLTGSSNSFSVAPEVVLTTRHLAGLPLRMKTTCSRPMAWAVWISVPGRGVVIPNHLLLRGDLGHAELMGEENVAIGQQHGVADFAFGPRVGVFVRPVNFALAHNIHSMMPVAFAGIKEIVLGQSPAGRRSGPPACCPW